MPKVRADVLIARRGLAPSRARAQALILAGKVFSGERRVEKSGDTLDDSAPLEVREPDHPFVSRGGVKLAGALDAFGYDPVGKTVADFGASCVSVVTNEPVWDDGLVPGPGEVRFYLNRPLTPNPGSWGGPIGGPARAYDITNGGTTTLVFDTASEELLDSRYEKFRRIGVFLENAS